MPDSTPQSEWAYAGFWIRTGALCLDVLLIIAVTWTPLIIFYGWDYLQSRNFMPGPMDMVLSHLVPSAALVGFWYYKSATPGKMLLGLMVVDAPSGKRLTLGQCFMRCLGYYLSFFCAGLGFLWVAFDPRKQAWHDKWAHTAVVRRDCEAPAQEEVEDKLSGVVAPDVLPAG